ncbi:MAG: acetolactate synthase-1/3 small subunit [Verrucomicrobiales bacterium]|jgi:acetolactate synthase-1/3 small subunit
MNDQAKRKNIITTDSKLSPQADIVGAHTLSVFVSNQPGVLARIAQVFSRRAYNIDSLVVSQGRDPKFSRMTIGVSGDSKMLDQIIKQVNKLIDVIHCYEHEEDDAVVKEMVMVKIICPTSERTEVLQIINHFNGKTVDFTETSLIAMINGDTEKVDAAIRLLSSYEIIETVRTGKVVMARGELPT